MLCFNGVEAAISINSAELPCYHVERDDANLTVTCWVPSEAGKAFSVVWSSGLQYHPRDTAARVWIDGTPGDGMISESCLCREYPHIYSIDCVTVSSTTAYPMLFSWVDYADGHTVDNTDHSSNELGQIVITVHETTLVGNTPFHHVGESTKRRENEGRKKLRTHNVRLGEAMSIVSDSKTWCNTKDGRLLAKFVFKYQPLELLIAEGIAPANLYKRKDYDEDSDAEDEAQLNSVNNAIALLKAKFAARGRLLIRTFDVDPASNDEEDEDSDLERDEARWHTMHAAVDVLSRRLAKKGKLVKTT